MAIGVAMLYANTPSMGFDDSDSWGTLLNNRFGIRSIAIHEGWCMILMMLNLRRAGLNSVYCLILATLAAIVVGVAANKTILHPDPDKVYEMLKDKNTLPECGDNPSLRTFCVNSSTPTSILNAVPDCSVFLLLTIVSVCWVENTCPRVASCSWFQSFCSRLSQECLERVAFCSSRLISLGLGVAESAMVTFLWYGLCILGASSGPQYNTSLGVNWNIGQVIAVLVWAPVVSKYLYLLLLS
ncbi:hypothetical protein CEP54_014370 [Fusarium duplospermum]|uniref:Uncharacterized protein n=1 Tax=Fusarium duplospermum TaxID=1325734 RepID=A0A428NWV0_9HYPO|nr:hypothetical protein CEP54_014370 [Fusarium duplospermum]